MSNKRLYFAHKSAQIAECGSNDYVNVHGLQSIGITTRFNLEQVWEIGQVEIYEQSENLPDVEVTMEKVLDGHPLIYHLATVNSPTGSLSGRSNRRASVGMSVFSDVQDAASGTPLTQCTMSGVYISALDYNFPVQGNFTESVTLVGNSKVWNHVFTADPFDNQDEPLAITGSGGVQQRQDFVMGEQAGNKTLLPTEIPGITASGTNPYSTVTQDHAVKVQNIRVQANLGREQLFELGKKGPYHRYVSFPIEVRCDIEVLSLEGDEITALEDQDNLTDHTIVVVCKEGTKVDLGSRNKLTNVTYGGANAGQQGGNATATYSYSNFSSFLTVTHPKDPTEALRE